MTTAPENIKPSENGKETKDYGEVELALADMLFAAMMRSMPS